MRTYWLKIILGAFAIFLVGYAGWTACRGTYNTFDEVAHTSEPITIPLPFGILPFRVDGVRLGSIDRVTLERSAPEVITGIRVQVGLSEGTDAGQLAGCDLFGENINDFDENSSFRCLRPETADSSPVAMSQYQPFGTVTVDDLELTLLLSESDIAEFQDRSSPPGPPDMDSLNAAIRNQVDSAVTPALEEARRSREMADSIRRARLGTMPEN